MIQPDNCPYKGLNMCSKCPHYIIDTDQCRCVTLAMMNNVTLSSSNALCASSYEDKLRRYNEEREKLLKLSKEALVDLIIHRPDY